MKFFISFVLMLAIVCETRFASAANFYALNSVRRIESNLYSFRSGSVSGVIVTKYCYEYAYNEDALLRYEKYSFDNKIIFDNGTVCEVSEVFTK